MKISFSGDITVLRNGSNMTTLLVMLCFFLVVALLIMAAYERAEGATQFAGDGGGLQTNADGSFTFIAGTYFTLTLHKSLG